MGYPARRLYRHGHTLGDLWYTDADGIGRYHMFDNNYGWFVYTRDGSRIASAEEIGADFSLNDHPSRTAIPWIDKKMWMWGWCHMVQVALPGPRRMTLHPGESAERLWGNMGKPHDNNVGVRPWDDPVQPPYPRQFGNGVFDLTATFEDGWRDQLAGEPVNVVAKGGALVQKDPATPGEIVYRVALPYIVADGEVMVASSGGGVAVTTDRAGGERRIKPGVACTEQGLTSRTGGPPGRYAYEVRVRLDDGARLDAFTIRSVVQLNSFSLPALLAGENRITVGGRLAKGYAVEVRYVWSDRDGKGRTHTAVADRLPLTYTIRTAGKGWADVVCNRVVTRVVRADGKGSRVVTDVPAPSVAPDGPLPQPDVRTIIGPTMPPPPIPTAACLADLKSDSTDVRRAAAAALGARRDPEAWDGLVDLAFNDVTQAKMHAIQALFWTDRKRAAPVIRRILNKDPVVKWPEGRNDALPIHSNVVGTVAAMCGLSGFRDLVPEINDLAWKTSTNARWACVRALGRINDPRGYPAIRRFCRSGNDDTASVANEAAGRIRDPEAVANAARWLRSKRYPIRTLKAIEAVGRFGKAEPEYTDLFLLQLRRWGGKSEDWRATVSTALSRVGDPDKSIPVVEKMRDEEQWPWVREKMDAALEQLRSRQK